MSNRDKIMEDYWKDFGVEESVGKSQRQIELDEKKEKVPNNMEKRTLVVNLFAGPGAGKSTGAAYIFSKLKMDGYDCEYVSEFAKDKVWENNGEVFKSQFYITGKQVFKIKRCYGKVDIIVTDSPIAIGAQYVNDSEVMLGHAILEEFSKYNNLNLFINRVKKYNPNGRNQTESEAKEIDERMKTWLQSHNIPFETIDGNEEGYKTAVELIEQVMNLGKK